MGFQNFESGKVKIFLKDLCHNFTMNRSSFWQYFSALCTPPIHTSIKASIMTGKVLGCTSVR